MGQQDPDYVDAYYGPPEWKKELKEKKSLNAIALEATRLSDRLAKISEPRDEMERLRRGYLAKQLAALETRVRILNGERLKFDEESRALYDAVAPSFPESHFQEILARLEPKLPGEGSLSQRYENWRRAFVIPKDKLDTVFQLAIKACRERTLAHIKLPPEENFSVEYVTNKPWGGYNWYKGNFRSVIQVNTDLPIYVDRAIDLAAHEGYPGHHVYNALLEKNLARDRGWVEFTVYPLFSPQSLIAEGTANFGREVVFTKPERLAFEEQALWPAAGMDRSRVQEFYDVHDLVKKLGYATNEAARRYLNGEINADAATTWLQKYALMDEKRAKQSLRFIENTAVTSSITISARRWCKITSRNAAARPRIRRSGGASLSSYSRRHGCRAIYVEITPHARTRPTQKLLPALKSGLKFLVLWLPILRNTRIRKHWWRPIGWKNI